MDRILILLKKENGPRASSAPALELKSIIFKHVYWYMQQISGERLQDHWSSGLMIEIHTNHRVTESMCISIHTYSSLLCCAPQCSMLSRYVCSTVYVQDVSLS